MKPKHAENYDVIIVGGGITGLSLAFLLSQKQLNVAIIESQKNEIKWDKDKCDLRVSAINSASKALFQKINAWQSMQNMRVSSYWHMYVWDAMSHGEIHFDCTEVGMPNLGYIIENSVIQTALLKCLNEHNNIRIFYSVPQDLINTNDSIFLTLEDEKVLQAKLIIGADGARSWVRERARISHQASSYQQTAIVTTVRTEKTHNRTAWQRFLPDSTLAFLPLEDNHHCSIVWSVNNECIHSMMSLSEIEFNCKLQESFENKLGQIEILDKRLSFPLMMRHAKKYVQPRIALIGDAARTIHPLAGQGINLGLQDVNKLAQSIQSALEKKQDIGNILTLRNYERSRKADNLMMITAMQGFKRLFNNQHSVLTQIRGLGLNITQKTPMIKNLFIKKAMGLELF